MSAHRCCEAKGGYLWLSRAKCIGGESVSKVGVLDRGGLTPQSTYIDVEDADGPGAISDQQRRAGIEAGANLT